ncbi:hypothetical protein J6590_078039 [Homalodisca vitripennis]|nr:hypothetical protein J6590_078039 [Homalodisca vitripennis]
MEVTKSSRLLLAQILSIQSSGGRGGEARSRVRTPDKLSAVTPYKRVKCRLSIPANYNTAYRLRLRSSGSGEFFISCPS